MDQVGGLGRGGEVPGDEALGSAWRTQLGTQAERVQRLVNRQGERQLTKGDRADGRGGLQAAGFSRPTWFREKPSSEHLGTHSEWGLCLRSGGDAATGYNMRNLRTLCSMRYARHKRTNTR